MRGPQKRKNVTPRVVRITTAKPPYLRTLTLFIDKDGRLALQVEDPDGGAEILLDHTRVYALIQELERFRNEQVEWLVN